MPTTASSSSTSDPLSNFIIRSVPILPEPMIAVFILAIRLTFIPFSVAVGGEFCANCSNSFDSCPNNVTAVHPDHRTPPAGQDYVAFQQRPSDTRTHPRQPQGPADRAAKTGKPGTNTKG